MKYKDRSWNLHEKPKDKDSITREWVYGLYVEDWKILLNMSTWVDIWDLPWGTREQWESLEETLKREIDEELGYEILEFNDKPIKIEEVKFYAEDLDAYLDSTMYYLEIKKLWKQDKRHIHRSEISKYGFKEISKLTKDDTNNHHYDIIKTFEND